MTKLGARSVDAVTSCRLPGWERGRRETGIRRLPRRQEVIDQSPLRRRHVARRDHEDGGRAAAPLRVEAQLDGLGQTLAAGDGDDRNAAGVVDGHL